MAIHWVIPFKSFTGTSYRVEIYDDDYTGSEVTLLGAGKPFVTNEDDSDDFYTPVRSQSGYIRFIVEDLTVVEAMMPTSATQHPVVLRESNSEVAWMGFMSCEQYSQPWDRAPYEIELPVVSVMEAMRGVEFTQNDGYTTIFSLMQTISSYLPEPIDMHIPTATPIGDVCVNNNNFRKYLTPAERTERSTTNIYECISMYDVVAEFCTYYGLSLHEYMTGMYFIVHDQDSVTYMDYDLNGYSREPQIGVTSLESLSLCGDNNLSEFSKPYRRIVGTFAINPDSAKEIYKVEEFNTQFSVNGKYPPANPWYLIFNGNSEVLPYANGTQQVTPIGIGPAATYSGGQLLKISKYEDGSNTRGKTYSDYIFIYSKKSSIGSPETAMKILPPRKIYINNGENTLLHITGDVFGDNYSDFTGDRLYLKIKIGNYWLKSYIPSGSTYTSYSWETTEQTAYLELHDHAIMHATIDNIPTDVKATLESYSGFAVMMPSVSAGYYDISIELLANAQESESEFGEFSGLGQLIKSFNIDVMRGNDAINTPTPQMDSNSVIRIASNTYTDDYKVDSSITTRRGMQFGAGAALATSTKAYVTTEYDRVGVERRAALMEMPRKVLTVYVRTPVPPYEEISYNTQAHTMLSQSIDWRDDVATLKMIQIS